MIFYIYDKKTKEFKGQQLAFLDPLESKKQNKNIYLVPALSTDKEPPKTKKNQVAIFSGSNWKIVSDYRGQTYYIGTKQYEMKEIGELPSGATLEPVEYKKTETEVLQEQTEQKIITAEIRISEIKDQLLIAVLLDDTEMQKTLKAEYKSLLENQ